MTYITQSKMTALVNELLAIETLNNALKNGFESIVNNWLATTDNKRKRVFDININFVNFKINFTINRVESYKVFGINLLKQLLNKYNITYSRINYCEKRSTYITPFDYTKKLIENISELVIDENGEVIINFSKEFYDEQNEIKQNSDRFKKEYLNKYIKKYEEVKEYTDSIEMDENASKWHRRDDQQVIKSFNEYLDFLQEHYFEMNIDEMSNQFNFHYFSGYSVIRFDYKFDREALNAQLQNILNHQSAIIDIVPIIKVEDDVKYGVYNDFQFVYSKDYIACEKYLEHVRGIGIAAYYASKQSGDYTGD